MYAFLVPKLSLSPLLYLSLSLFLDASTRMFTWVHQMQTRRKSKQISHEDA
jgi:hypothetical protein